jgi:putative endonuclease
MSSDLGSPAWGLAERPDPRRLRGEQGEDIAARYLESRGFRILQRGYRARCGEIDLIARDGEDLVFVEVKCRTSSRCGDPLEAVTPAKRRRILRAASVYLQSNGAWEHPCRFDIVAVRLGPGGNREVEHLRGAFQADS